MPKPIGAKQTEQAKGDKALKHTVERRRSKIKQNKITHADITALINLLISTSLEVVIIMKIRCW